MPSRRSGGDIVMFSGGDPRPLVNWLCDNYGLQTILQSVAQYRPAGAAAEAPAKRAYKKRASKKRGAKKGAGKRGSKKSSRKQASSETGTS